MNYCVVLTDGEDEQFGINRVYLTDHQIDPAEWSAEMQTFNERVKQAQEAAYSKRGLRYGYVHDQEAHDEVVALMKSIHPLPAFVEKHKLVQVEHVELWTGGSE